LEIVALTGAYFCGRGRPHAVTIALVGRAVLCPPKVFWRFDFGAQWTGAPYLALRHCAFALKMLPSGGCHYAKPFCALARGHLGRSANR